MSGDRYEPKVTANAVMATGFVTAALAAGARKGALAYTVEEIEPADASLVLINDRTGTVFEITVRQIGGPE